MMLGRHDRPDDRRRRRHGGRKLSRIAVAFHRRDQHRPQCRGIGDGRAAQAREQDARQNVDVRQTAPKMTDEHARERHQPPRDVPGVHDLAGQDEQGNRQQRELVDTGEDPLQSRMKQRGLPVDQESDERSESQSEDNRHPDQDAGDGDDDEERHGYSSTSAGRSFRTSRKMFSRQIGASSPKPTGRAK